MDVQAFCILSLIFTTSLAEASLLAHFDVSTDTGGASPTIGRITVELEYETAPQAVANFITLSQGTRARIDYNTGAVTTVPLYVGEKFFRTANTDSIKFAQTGSGTGSNQGNTGFTFKDEFDDSKKHEGYTLSSANAGPNTNGGGIFLTGDVSIPTYDNVHTIIGLIPSTDPASREVTDAVISAGTNATTITAVTIERTDPAAEAFDEFAQDLPHVSQLKGNLAVEKDNFTRFDFEAPASTGDIVRAYRSGGLENWIPLYYQHIGIADDSSTPTLLTAPLDDATWSRAFYNISIARHSDSVAPSDFGSRTLTVTFSSSSQTYIFDADGANGRLEVDVGGENLIVGTFTSSGLTTGPHSSVQILSTSLGIQSVVPPGEFVQYVLRLKCGWDSAETDSVDGRVSSERFDGIFGDWIPNGSGEVSVTR